jgi:hypothetical protein
MAHLPLVLIVVIVAIALLLGTSRCTMSSRREFMTPKKKNVKILGKLPKKKAKNLPGKLPKKKAKNLPGKLPKKKAKNLPGKLPKKKANKVCVAHQTTCTVKPSDKPYTQSTGFMTRWYAHRGKCQPVKSRSGFTSNCTPNKGRPILFATKGGCEKKCGLVFTGGMKNKKKIKVKRKKKKANMTPPGGLPPTNHHPITGCLAYDDDGNCILHSIHDPTSVGEENTKSDPWPDMPDPHHPNDWRIDDSGMKPIYPRNPNPHVFPVGGPNVSNPTLPPIDPRNVIVRGGGLTDGVCGVTTGFGAPFPRQHHIKSLEQ